MSNYPPGDPFYWYGPPVVVAGQSGAAFATGGVLVAPAGGANLVPPAGTATVAPKGGDATWESQAVGAIINFKGVAGTYLSVPDAPNLDITGDLEIVVRVSHSSWTSGWGTIQGYISKADVGAGTGRSILVRHHATSQSIEFLWSVDGSAFQPTATFSHPAWPNNTFVWFRARFDADNGSGQHVISLDYSLDNTQTEPTNWTALTPVTRAGTTSIFASSRAVVLGADNTARTMTGRLPRAIVRSGIGGTTVLDVDETNILNETVTTFLARTDQTVTVVGDVLDPKTV